MARLRKPCAPTDPPQWFAQPASSQSSTISSSPKSRPRTTRSSPRKALQSTSDSPRRELRYTGSSFSQQENNDESSFLKPKASFSGTLMDGESTPRRQRVLKPVASNSRLLRQLSDESLASPERKVRGSGIGFEEGGRRGHSYAKSLARTLAGNAGVKARREIVVESVERVRKDEPMQEPEQMMVHEDGVDMETSLCCDEGDNKTPELEEFDDAPEEQEHSEEDSDDDDSIVDVRNRRRQAARPRTYALSDDNESDQESEELAVNVATEKERQTTEEKTQALPQSLPPLQALRPSHKKGHSTISNWAQEVVDLTSSPEVTQAHVMQPAPRPESPGVMSRPTSSYSSNMDAMLQYSPTPTKHRSPRKAPPISRPSTPPLPLPSPSKLVSPSKKKNRIPQAPGLRPSLDAFWAADVVNEWNEKHSPAKKPPMSPRKQKWLNEIQGLDLGSESDASYTSPTTSPKKNSTQPKPNSSPAKKGHDTSAPNVAEVRAQRKAFASSKHALAESFLAELDNTLTDGRIATQSAATGGIKLVWSKTLKTTAGRANWRREQLRLRTGLSPTDIETSYRHHCSIELAEKVIDDEERLYNVLAHEFCHLATFMISEVRNNPHGAEFKSWGAKATRAFASKGVEVTTKHSYQIAYKYVWECISCGYEFKRHSKSVDPARHSCGRCKGKLVQTKPAPRGTAKSGEKKGGSEYQVFVKGNFARVKKRMEGEGLETAMGKVMAECAREYREMKAKREKEAVVEVEELFEGLRIEDEGT